MKLLSSVDWNSVATSIVAVNALTQLMSTILLHIQIGRKHWALRPQKPLELIRDGEAGGSGIFIPNTYSQ